MNMGTLVATLVTGLASLVLMFSGIVAEEKDIEYHEELYVLSVMGFSASFTLLIVFVLGLR